MFFILFSCGCRQTGGSVATRPGLRTDVPGQGAWRERFRPVPERAAPAGIGTPISIRQADCVVSDQGQSIGSPANPRQSLDLAAESLPILQLARVANGHDDQ